MTRPLYALTTAGDAMGRDVTLVAPERPSLAALVAEADRCGITHALVLVSQLREWRDAAPTMPEERCEPRPALDVTRLRERVAAGATLAAAAREQGVTRQTAHYHAGDLTAGRRRGRRSRTLPKSSARRRTSPHD